MFKDKTLFVVGAGASHEAALPIGPQLAVQISKKLAFGFSFGQPKSGDMDLYQAMKRWQVNENQFQAYLAAAQSIVSGIRLVQSIDNYIDSHRDDARIASCGKFAITYLILQAEASSLIRTDPSFPTRFIKFEDVANTWYMAFARMLVDQVARADVRSIFENIAIVCFNYDRCIEHFLTHFIGSLYRMELVEAAEIVSGLTVIRPYGSVSPIFGKNAISYGTEPRLCDVGAISRNIKTYSEQIDDEVVLSSIDTAVADAHTIVFLGFAYHEQNLQLLLPPKGGRAPRIFSTAYGMSEGDADHLRARLSGAFATDQRHIKIRHSMKCSGLFDEYRISMKS